MIELRRCTKCVMPETWSGISFDEEGICSLCRAFEEENKIDWTGRQKQLEEILIEYKEYAKKKGNKYDVLIGFSSGKDSTYTLWAAKIKYGLRPLALTFDHGLSMSANAEENMRIPARLDIDHIRFNIGKPLRNALCRRTTEVMGDWCWYCHNGVGSLPARVSMQWDIPLQLWGERTSRYSTTGDYKTNDREEQDEEHYRKTFQGGIIPEMVLPEGYELRDLLPMTWPTIQNKDQLPLRGLYLGSFELWDQRKQVDIIKREVGWKPVPTRVSYVPWDKCDCVAGEELRDVQKFHRRRVSRVAFQASKDIHEGLISREEGMKLIEEYEMKIPNLDVNVILKELGFKDKEELLNITKGI